jgi:hypothetical protein
MDRQKEGSESGMTWKIKDGVLLITRPNRWTLGLCWKRHGERWKVERNRDWVSKSGQAIVMRTCWAAWRIVATWVGATGRKATAGQRLSWTKYYLERERQRERSRRREKLGE